MVTRMAENSLASIIGSLEPFDPEIDNWPAYIERLEQFFKPVVCGWFLEIALVCAVSVCPPLRELITSGVIWCDIGRVRLIKQVHGFSLLLMTLSVGKMDEWPYFIIIMKFRIVGNACRSVT